MKSSTRIVKAPGGNKSSSIANLAEKVSKVSLYLLAFLLPLLFLPWTANVLEFNKQALLIVLVFVSIFAWLLKILIAGKAKFNLSFVHIPVGVLFLVYLISTIFSSWRYGSFWGWPQITSESLVSLMCLLLMYLLIVNSFEKKNIFYLLAIFIYSATLAGIYAILQLFGKFILPIGFTQTTSFNTVGSINTLGIFVAVLLPLAIMLLVVAEKKFYKISFIVSIAVFSIMALIVNFYIAWWLIIIGAALIFAFGMQRRDVLDNRWLILPMFFLAVGLLFAFFRFQVPGMPETPNEFFLKQGPTFTIAGKVLSQSPVIGTGPGTFNYSFAKFKDISFNQGNLWNIGFDWGASKALTILSTVGILGFLAFIALIGFFVFYGIIFLFRRKEQEDKVFYMNFAIGIFISFLVLSVGFFFYSSNLTLDFTYFILMASFIALLYPAKKEFELKPSSLMTLGFTFVITIIFVFGLGLFILEGQRYASARNYLEGMKNWQAGNYEEGLFRLERAVSVSPGVDLYWREIANAYLQNVQIVSAREDLTNDQKRQLVQISVNNAVNAAKTSADVNPSSVANWETRGLIYQSLIGTVGGTKDWAVEAFKEAMTLNPNSPYYPTQAGVAVLSQVALLTEEETAEKENLLNEAAEFFNQAIELKADYAPAHFQLSRIYSTQGKQDEMIASLEKAKEAAPFDVGLAFQLGLVYFQKEDFEKARTEFERAVILNPDYANALYFLGLSYYETNEKDMAIAIFEKILELNPGHELGTQILENMKEGRDALAGIQEENKELPIEEDQPIEE